LLSEAVGDVSVPWSTNWLWGAPLVVLTVVIHVLGLGFIDRGVALFAGRRTPVAPSVPRFVVVMGIVAWLATFLHAMEATVWALAYRWLGAIPNVQDAMLYSLSAMTSYGHAELFLDRPWQMLGAIESLNGIMLFGLTTAFLFFTMQRARGGL
jgi:hypothetical protein